MSTPLEKANAIAASDPSQAEQLYKQILKDKAGESWIPSEAPRSQPRWSIDTCNTVRYSVRSANDEQLREQETALLKLGGLYKAAG